MTKQCTAEVGETDGERVFCIESTLSAIGISRTNYQIEVVTQTAALTSPFEMTSSYFSKLPGTNEVRGACARTAMPINAAAPKRCQRLGRPFGVGSKNDCLLDPSGDGFFCRRRGAFLLFLLAAWCTMAGDERFQPESTASR